LPRSPVHDRDRAQNDLCLGLSLSFVGACNLLPVARLYRARPFAVRPAPLETGNFSPRPTASDGPRFLAMPHLFVLEDRPERVFAELGLLWDRLSHFITQQQRTSERDHAVAV
jgi:hypothetical protein